MITPTTSILRLYGEWSLWHSTAPDFRKPDCVVIYLYPNARIDLCVFQTMGPFLLQDRQMGNFSVKNHGVEPHVHNPYVHIDFVHGERRVLSVFGIGVDDSPVSFPLYMDEQSRQMNLKLDIVGPDDLFLTSRFHSHHLVRSMKRNVPSINVPFSTLVATHLTGMMISFFVKKMLMIMMSITW